MSLAQPGPTVGPQTVVVKFQMPRAWRDELDDISRDRAISRADLLRQMVRDLMKRAHE